MKKLLVICLLLTILPVNAIVEDKKINLQEAISTALEINPQIKMSKLDIEKSKNDIKIANRLQNPSLTTDNNIGSTARGNAQQIGVDYVVEVLKRNNRKKVAQSNSTIAINNQKFQEICFISDIKIAYINFLLKKSNLKIITQQKELSNDILKHTIENSTKGKSPKTDVIQAKIAYNRSVLYENIAQSEVIKAQNEFNTIMNSGDLNYDTKEDYLDNKYENLYALNPKDNFLTFDKIKNYALSSRYDLKKAQQEVESAQNNLKVVQAKLIPDIEFSGGYQYQTKGMNDSNAFKNGAYAGASITNIPLVYRYKPEIENAKLDIEKAKLNYEDVKLDAIRNITDAWEKYTIAKDTLNFYNDKLLNNSKELLDESVKNLEKKEIDLTSFLVSKKLYLELILGHQEALSDYYISFAQLLKEINIYELDEVKKIK